MDIWLFQKPELLDALFHEESEYGLGFYFWPCFSEINYQKLFVKNALFEDFRFFTTDSILSLSLSKQKVSKNFFLSKYLELKALQTLKIPSKSEISFLQRGSVLWLNYEKICSLFRILSDQKSESSGLVHVVEQWILYKTLYMAVLMNSIFPNVLFAQNDCHASQSGPWLIIIHRMKHFKSHSIL